jgi:hypothetical protein
MRDPRTEPRIQLPVYLPAAGAPQVEGVTRQAVVRLLAYLLISAGVRPAGLDGPDEGR